MTILTFNEDSLRRGKVSHNEVKEALDDPMVVEAEYGESKDGNPTVLYVGKTQLERLLEVGIEYKEHEDHVYHARKANANRRNAYQRRWI